MNAEQFLERLIAPGHFIAVAFKSAQFPLSHRFFPRTDAGQAARFIKWCASKGTDAWHACASYQSADKEDKNGRTIYKGRRTQDNVEQIKAFWVDLDIKRPGDGKDPSQVYADLTAAVSWVRNFLHTTKVPPPNLWVHSGYGLHLYWVLEDAVDAATWQTYALALKYAVQATGGLCDMAVIADHARILRPPESQNFKDPANPKPVQVINNQTRSDYPNSVMYAALQAYVGLMPAPTTVAASPTMGGLGPAPTYVQASALANNATQNVAPAVKDKSFAEIAKQCLQVKHSLATHGAQDSRTIWYLGNLSLAYHTFDGDKFVHDLSSAGRNYTPAGLDAIVAQVAAEKAKKDTGPPRCTTYNSVRPGICPQCPFFNKVVSPWNVGAPDADLPKNYRRQGGTIEQAKLTKEGAIVWNRVVSGDVYGPILISTSVGYAISFTYHLAGKRSVVSAKHTDIRAEVGASIGLWASQNVQVDRRNTLEFGDFIMAWIEQLRMQRAEQDVADPYGWHMDDKGGPAGFAVGGLLYNPDGTTEQVPGSDPNRAEAYRPRGDIAKWQRAATFLSKDRPFAQAIMALSMGAPLMKFTGESGLVMHFWSRDSGLGKSAVFKVAQNVWATTATMTTTDDTVNAIRGKVGDARCMPLLWDELRMDKENARERVNFFFSMTQGKDKARMRPDTTVGDAKEWQTLVASNANSPLFDFVIDRTSNTDAGAIRLLDFEIDEPRPVVDPSVAVMVADAGSAAGSAGAVMAAKFAKEGPRVQQLVTVWSAKLSQIMTSTSEERFYLAGAACMMTAAQLATEAGLVKFDIPALWGFIKGAWDRARAGRSNMMVRQGQFDLAEIFGQFKSKYGSNVVVTNYFKGRGLPPKDFKTIEAPLNDKAPLVLHGAQREAVIRFDRATFVAWCHEKGFSPTEIIKAMQARWMLAPNKCILGAGTMYGTGGQKQVLELPLNHAELADYDLGTDPTDPKAQQNQATTVAAPAAQGVP